MLGDSASSVNAVRAWKQHEQSFITLKHFGQTLTGPGFCTRYIRGDRYQAGAPTTLPLSPRIRPLIFGPSGCYQRLSPIIPAFGPRPAREMLSNV